MAGLEGIAFLDAADERISIVGRCKDDVIVLRNDMKGMHEVELFLSAKALEKGGRLFDVQSVPADMGYGKINGKSFHHPRDNTQAFDVRGFLTVFEQGL